MKWGRRWGNPWGDDSLSQINITDLETVPPTALVEWPPDTSFLYHVYIDGKFYDTTTGNDVTVPFTTTGRHWVEIFLAATANVDEDLSTYLTSVPGTRCKLTWTAPGDEDVSYYKIYWDSGDGSPMAYLDRTKTDETSWISSIFDNGTYEFRVNPIDKAGNEKTSAATVVVVIAAYPEPPAGLALVSYAGGVASFSFTESTTPGVVGYKIYHNGGSGDYIDYATAVKTIGATDTFTLTLGSGTWKVGIRAYTGALEEDNVDVFVEFEIAGSPSEVLDDQPNIPGGLVVVPAAGGAFQLTCNYEAWEELAKAVSVNFYADDGAGGAIDYSSAIATGTVPDHNTGENAVLVIAGTSSVLTDGLTYTFAARAVTSGGRESASSDTATGTADATEPGDISSLTGEAVNYEEA